MNERRDRYLAPCSVLPSPHWKQNDLERARETPAPPMTRERIALLLMQPYIEQAERGNYDG